MKKFSQIKKIEKKHLDIFGHVNNAEYLRLYEDARWELIRLEGLDEQSVISEKIGPVILEIKLSFKKEITLNEEIEIKLVETTIVNRLIYGIKQQMLKNGEIASTLELTLGIMDLKTRKLIKPPLKWLKALGL